MHSVEGLTELFSSVLVSRTNQSAPSELELEMRKVTHRLRVVERLSGGAHLLLPSDNSIALRTYYPPDIERLNDSMDWKVASQAFTEGNPMVDADDLAAFRDAFQFPFVFFVLPLATTASQTLDHAGSFIHRAQMIMNDTIKNTRGGAFVVPDVMSIIKILVQLAVNLKPEKRALRGRYYSQAKEKYFIPDLRSGLSPNLRAAANHVQNEFQKWADLYELPPGEAAALMSQLGTLGAIAGASHVDLETVPIIQDTKTFLHKFFGSKGKTQGVRTADESEEHDHDIRGRWDHEDTSEPPPALFPSVPSHIFCEPYEQHDSPMESSGSTAGGYYHHDATHARPDNHVLGHIRHYQAQAQAHAHTQCLYSPEYGTSILPFSVMSNRPTPPLRVMNHAQLSSTTPYQRQRALPSSRGDHHRYSSRSDFSPTQRQYY